MHGTNLSCGLFITFGYSDLEPLNSCLLRIKTKELTSKVQGCQVKKSKEQKRHISNWSINKIFKRLVLLQKNWLNSNFVPIFAMPKIVVQPFFLARKMAVLTFFISDIFFLMQE